MLSPPPWPNQGEDSPLRRQPTGGRQEGPPPQRARQNAIRSCGPGGTSESSLLEHCVAVSAGRPVKMPPRRRSNLLACRPPPLREPRQQSPPPRGVHVRESGGPPRFLPRLGNMFEKWKPVWAILDSGSPGSDQRRASLINIAGDLRAGVIFKRMEPAKTIKRLRKMYKCSGQTLRLAWKGVRRLRRDWPRTPTDLPSPPSPPSPEEEPDAFMAPGTEPAPEPDPRYVAVESPPQSPAASVATELEVVTISDGEDEAPLSSLPTAKSAVRPGSWLGRAVRVSVAAPSSPWERT